MRLPRVLTAIVALLCIASAAEARGGGLSRGGASNPGIKYPWRFAYVTDTHVNWPNGGISPRNSYMFTRCVDTLNTLHSTAIGMDLLVLGGDWDESSMYGNLAANADSFVAITNRARFMIYPVPGNWEALASDTLLAVNPYRTSTSRFSAMFGGRNYWYTDWKNARFVALQDNANYSVDQSTDYRRNNPTTYAAPTGGVTGYDYDGITVSTSPQRVMLQAAMDGKDDSHWIIVAAHRPCFGSSINVASRHNFTHNYKQNSWLHDIESRLGTGERGLCLLGDQHIPLWFTRAIYDSTIASATGKGLYHLIVASGSAARQADTTEMLGGASLAAFLYWKDTPARLIGRTSTAWADTVTLLGDAKIDYHWTWSLMTVYADHIMVETFRTFDGVTPSKYHLGGQHRLIDRRTISRDN